MKRPTYYIREQVQVPGKSDEFFPAWTMVQPIWNEDYVPDHLKQDLKDYKRFNLNPSGYVMCIIGRCWVVVGKDNIVERY